MTTLSHCRSCQAPIVWGRTRNDVLMPLDAEPSADSGNALLHDDGMIDVLGPLEVLVHDRDAQPLRVPHHATCPDRDQWTRGKPIVHRTSGPGGRRTTSMAEIIAAYERTGSVWKAGKELGCAGQTVHERLRAIGYRFVQRRWDDDEVDELRSLLGQVSLAEIANRLGRPYAGVACKVSELGLSSKRDREVKLPRGAGYDKASVTRYVKQLEESGDLATRFAKRNALNVESLARAIERYFPEWWLAYRQSHSDLAERICGYCERPFIPNNGKQQMCSRRCGDQSREDIKYFGGKRRQTVGLLEEQCQLCGRVGVKGLSAHHVLGKENDPDNDVLIALCPGCHKTVTLLASRTFVDEPFVWEALIQLTWMRRHGGDEKNFGVYSSVEIEPITEADILDEAYEQAEPVDGCGINGCDNGWLVGDDGVVPCSACRPGQYEAWMSGRYAPAGTVK